MSNQNHCCICHISPTHSLHCLLLYFLLLCRYYMGLTNEGKEWWCHQIKLVRCDIHDCIVTSRVIVQSNVGPCLYASLSPSPPSPLSPVCHRSIGTTVHLATPSTVLWRKGWVEQPRTSMCMERSSLASRLGYQQLMTASNSPIVGLVCLLYFWCFILKLST